MSVRNRIESARAFRRFATFLDEITDEEFEGLVRGSLSIGLVHQKRNAPENSSTKDEEFLVAALRSSISRRGALELLRSEKRSRAELVHIARRLQIHVEKHDKIESVEEKIVENVIGARLRTEAIQGLSLKGSSSDMTTRMGHEGESSPAPPSRVSKDAPSAGRNGTAKRALAGVQRDELRNKLIGLSSLLFTSTRELDWWVRRLEIDVPEIVEGVNAAIAAFPDSDELKRNVRILRSRLDRATDDAKKGRPIGMEETQSIATALNDVAGTLMRISLDG
jgi:hypothetical protein